MSDFIKELEKKFPNITKHNEPAVKTQFPNLTHHFEVVTETSVPEVVVRQNELSLLREQTDQLATLISEIQALKVVWQQNGEKEREFLDRLLKVI